MNREVWLKADDEVGDWDARRRRITAGLEAGVDRVVVDESDVERVRELGDVGVVAFETGGDVDVVGADVNGGDPEVRLVGKGGEGDGTVALPGDAGESATL
ncbi:MAG: 3-dehydroquinate synthase II, partial [Halobacteriales archaeon]